MTVMDDFSPIAEQGELEPGRGRFARRRELAAVGMGYSRVLIGEDGVPLRELSPGEKYWKRACGWVNVDVSDHTLEFAVAFADHTGRASFVADVTVMCSVANPAEAARRGITSVKQVLEPVLRRTVVRAAAEMTRVEEEDAILALSETRKRAASAVQTIEDTPIDIPGGWLAGHVMSATVRFDDETAKHLAGLVARSRDAEVIGADGANDMIRTGNAMNVRDLVRARLGVHLANPATRASQVVCCGVTARRVDGGCCRGRCCS